MMRSHRVQCRDLLGIDFSHPKKQERKRREIVIEIVVVVGRRVKNERKKINLIKDKEDILSNHFSAIYPSSTTRTRTTTMTTATTSSSSVTDIQASASSHPEPAGHHMRIASQGTIKNYVTFAVNFLKERPTQPLTLHTLPFVPPSEDSADSASSSKLRTTPSNPRASASSIPQLISVVELVKRTYLSLLSPPPDTSDASSSEKVERWIEKARKRGLWQYNETGILEDIEHEFVFRTQDKKPDTETDEAEKALEKLKHVLGGKAGPKMIHTPYMKITLSTVPIPSLASRKEVTCQPIVLPPRAKKSTNKARQARRQKLRQALRKKADEPNSTSAQTTTVAPISVPAVVPGDLSAEGRAAGTKRAGSQIDGEKKGVQGKKKQKVLA